MIATPPARPWPTAGSCSNANVPSIDSSNCAHNPSLQTDDFRGPYGPTSQPPSRLTNHRHSLVPHASRKPLRSSPLAGPALQVTGGEENPRPSRTTSTPDLISLITPPPRLRHARPKTAESPLHMSQHSTLLSPRLLHPPERIFPSAALKDDDKKLTPSVARAPPVGSLSALRRPPSMVESLKNGPPPLSSVTQRPKSAHGYPVLESTQPAPEHMPQAQVRDPADSSWLTTNSYAVTPKFSRLGLASSNVVLPVSAREHKRMSRQTSKSSNESSTSRVARAESVSSFPGETPTLPLQTAPSSKSNHSNPLETQPGLPRPWSSATPSVTIVTDITVIDEGEESDHRSAASPTSVPHESLKDSIPRITSKKGRFSRLKTFSLRSIRSSNSLPSSRLVPIDEKVTPHNDELQGEIVIGLSTKSSNSSMSNPTEESKTLPSSLGFLSRSSKKSSGVRRIWKSITSNWQLGRSH